MRSIRSCHSPRSHQRGLTLIELMIAMAISLVIALAAVSGLIVSQRGFRTVDAASQLRDNGRFSSDLIRRIGVQTGFRDRVFAATERSGANTSAPNVSGFNNAILDASAPLATPTARAAGGVGYGSDILVLRYQSAETFPGSAGSDGSMIDCAGNATTALPSDRDDRMVSIFHVAVDQGEPTLMCTYSATGAAPWSTVPVVQGIENFQVLYAVASATAGTGDSPVAFLRADQFSSNDDWRRVRSLRIGMVLRGALNSAQERAAQTLYPFGLAKSSDGGSKGSAFAATADPGTAFSISSANADGRLRQVVTFTVHLRNDQTL